MQITRFVIGLDQLTMRTGCTHGRQLRVLEHEVQVLNARLRNIECTGEASGTSVILTAGPSPC
jgi:hypothetical protein